MLINVNYYPTYTVTFTCFWTLANYVALLHVCIEGIHKMQLRLTSLQHGYINFIQKFKV